MATPRYTVVTAKHAVDQWYDWEEELFLTGHSDHYESDNDIYPHIFEHASLEHKRSITDYLIHHHDNRWSDAVVDMLCLGEPIQRYAAHIPKLNVYLGIPLQSKLTPSVLFDLARFQCPDHQWFMMGLRDPLLHWVKAIRYVFAVTAPLSRHTQFVLLSFLLPPPPQ